MIDSLLSTHVPAFHSGTLWLRWVAVAFSKLSHEYKREDLTVVKLWWLVFSHDYFTHFTLKGGTVFVSKFWCLLCFRLFPQHFSQIDLLKNYWLIYATNASFFWQKFYKYKFSPRFSFGWINPTSQT